LAMRYGHLQIRTPCCECGTVDANSSWLIFEATTELLQKKNESG
jgi:hypothetical protein